MVEMEVKANILEVELACTLEGQRGASATRGKTTRGDSKSLASRRIRSSFQVSEGVRMHNSNVDSSNIVVWARRQGFNIGFNACEFIMQACYPEAGEAIGSLISQNASPEEIIDFVRQRKECLRMALELADLLLPPSSKA